MRVEAGGVAVVDVAVAGGVEERGAEAHPVAVVGQFHGGDLGVDVLRLVGQRVEAVVADGPVELVGEVEAADVAVAGPAEVGDVDLVRLEDADRVGPHQEVVLVEVEARLVVVVVDADLRRVAGQDEVLAVDSWR